MDTNGRPIEADSASALARTGERRASAPRPPAGKDPRAHLDREPGVALLAARVRVALSVIVLSNIPFALADLRLPAGVLERVLWLKGLQFLAVALALAALPRLASRRAVSVVAVTAGGLVLTLVAISGGATADLGMTIVLCVGMVLGAATWIPWGAAPQIGIAMIAAAAMLVNLELLHLGAGAVWSYAGLGVAFALMISVVLAATLMSQRRAAERLDAERVRTEAALRSSEADLRGIFESLQDVFYRTDLDGRILAVSPSVTRFGYTIEELIGSDVRHLYADASVRAPNIAKLLEQGFLRDFELTLVSKDGQPVPVSANVRLLHDESGQPMGLEGMLRDIRERKRAEQELRMAFDQLDERVRARTADLEDANTRLREASEAAREAEHRFRTVSELASDYAYCFRLRPDDSAVVEWITMASFERVTGYRSGEIERLGGGLGLVHPDDKPVVVRRLEALVAGNPDVSEFRIIRKGGEVRWIREHGYPERAGGDGPVIRIYAAAQDITERKRAQAQLADALRQRENVMETVPDIIYSIDCNGRLADWNRRLEVVTGLERSRVEGIPATDFFVPEDRARVSEAIERAFVEGYGTVEARVQTTSGPRLYHYSAVPLRDEAGGVVGLTGVGRDISELKDAERRTAVLLDVARDVSGTLDMDDILDRIQRRAADLLRCDIVATFCWDTESDAFRVRSHFGVPPGLSTQVAALAFPLGAPFDGEVAGGKAVVLDDLTLIPEVAAIISSGTLIAAPLRARGRYLGALVALRPGSPASFEPAEVELCEGIATQLALTLEGAELYRRQQEETTISGAVARVGHELIAALDGPDLLGELCKVTVDVLSCDASHTLFRRPETNRFVSVASHGYAPETWEQIRLFDIPTAWASAPQGIAQPAARRLVAADLPPVARALAESIGLERALVMPLFRGSEVIGVHTACYLRPGHDFTRIDERIGQRIAQLASLALDHARAVEATNEASRLKSEFVATMSHELRTPLNVIVGYHEMLLDSAFGDLTPAQREGLARADASARGLLALITETLDLSRLEAGHATVEATEVSLADLAREVMVEAHEHGGKETVHLSCDVSADLPRLHTDAGKLRVVLKNLLSNALKFTDSGTVGLAAVAINGGLEISVHDSGIGIPPEALDYIYEPFRQADGSSTRQHDGVGLGLYIVRRLLDILGGSIVVESEVGVGSTFRVRLPLRACAVSRQEGRLAELAPSRPVFAQPKPAVGAVGGA